MVLHLPHVAELVADQIKIRDPDRLAKDDLSREPGKSVKPAEPRKAEKPRPNMNPHGDQ